MLKIFEPTISTEISANIPESTLNISDDKKIEIVLNLMKIFRDALSKWNERAFNTTVLSIGILLTSVGYWILHGGLINIKGRIVIAIGMVLFAILTQIYLLSAMRSYK